MSTAQAPVRQGRTSPAVAVTGAAHGLGHALTARLAGSERVRKVIAIDEQRGDVTGVIWRLADVRDPALAGLVLAPRVLVPAGPDPAPPAALRMKRAEPDRSAPSATHSSSLTRCASSPT